MLHFPCPKCGGKVETAESDAVARGNLYFKKFTSGHVTGHAHPALAVVGVAVSVGNFIYQRVPGGGAKKCTVCHLEFC